MSAYIGAALFFVIALIVLWVIFRIVLARVSVYVKKTKTSFDDMLLALVQSLRPPFYIVFAAWIALQSLALAHTVVLIINTIFIVLVVWQVVVVAQTLVDGLVARKKDDTGARGAYLLLGKIAKGILWVVAVLMILSNLGVNITSLVAGLGIGGVAIALALQSILSDLFSSFALYLDKPFEVGDFIVVDDKMGVVDYIGIKTTRITSLQGEELVMSNKDLTSARIQNFKKMQERRVVVSFGVVYNTSVQTLKEISTFVREIVEEIDGVRFDRCHFSALGDFSLNFELVYYVQSGDYNDFMDVQQAILIGVKKAFDEKGIEFAFPTQTIEMKKE